MTTPLDESDQAPLAEPVDEPSSPEPAQPVPGRRRARRKGARPKPRVAALAGLVAVLCLVFASWSVPAVHTVLLQSFTKQSDSFTELYFTGDPTFDGATVVVPLALNAHGTGVKSYQLSVTLQSPGGQAVATTTMTLAPRDGTPVPVKAQLQVKGGDVAQVQVALVGHPQTLHFHFGKPQTPNS